MTPEFINLIYSVFPKYYDCYDDESLEREIYRRYHIKNLKKEEPPTAD